MLEIHVHVSKEHSDKQADKAVSTGSIPVYESAWIIAQPLIINM